MWTNHAPYLAPRLEQEKAIPKSCGEAQITGNHLLPQMAQRGWDPRIPLHTRQVTVAELHGGFRTTGLRQPCSFHYLPGWCRKRMNVGTQQTLRGQNQDFAQQWSEKKEEKKMQRPGTQCDDVQHSSFNHQRALYPQCIVWAFQSPLELGLNFKEGRKTVYWLRFFYYPVKMRLGGGNKK